MKKIIILTLAFLCYRGKSQIAIDSNYFYIDTATNLYMPKQKVHISEIFTNNLNVFKTIPTYSYQKGHEFTLEGFKFTRYDQYIGGVKINGNSYVISSKSDTILNIGGKVVNNTLPPPSTIVSTLTAIQSLTNALNSYKYKWQDSLWESNIKDTKSDSLATYFPKVQLGIFKTLSNDFNNVNDYYYAYPIYISALKSSQDSIYFDSLYYVSAINGSIIKRLSTQQTNEKSKANNTLNKSNSLTNNENINLSNQPLSLAPCNNPCNSTNVTIHYYGGQGINTSEFKYLGICNNRLKNNCTGTTIYTKKDGNSGSVDYRSTNNNWPNQNDKVGITGHWCLEKVYEACNSLFGLNSYNNGYAQLDMQIKTSLQGSFWDPGTNIINVGKFQGTNSYQAVLDIVGHEYGHGVLISSSGLDGVMDISSLTALNTSAEEGTIAEGFCDILGQMVEFYVNSNYSTTGAINDFVQGGNHPSGFQTGQTRSFINPSQTGNPSSILGTNWVTPLNLSNNSNDFDVLTHQNSTVLSHWFYLLAQGGTGNSQFPYNNNYCVKAIGQTKAGKIAYLAATFFITNYNKNLIGARSACIAAATQLYGANSDEVAQTTEAFFAVGIGSKYNGQINIQNITVNTPGVIDVHYNAKININNVTVNPGSSTTTFYVSSNTEIEMLPNTNFNTGVWAELYIAPPNPCSAGARVGNTNGGGKNTDSNNDLDLVNAKNNNLQNQKELLFSVQPNPNNGEFKLTLNNNNELPKSITIRDYQGKEVKTINNPTEYELNIDLKTLNNGLFIITANYGDVIMSKRIIKQ